MKGMRPFLIAAITVAVARLVSDVFLSQAQEPVSTAFSTESVRLHLTRATMVIARSENTATADKKAQCPTSDHSSGQSQARINSVASPLTQRYAVHRWQQTFV
jgi:hypothetical protein